MNRLVIIDGNAALHRAYHAMPPLSDPDGNMVNAVYGFTSMMFKIFGDLKPYTIAVVFDRPAPTFRKTLFKEYQSKRPKMDEDLIPQIERVHDVVKAMGVPIFEKDGFEADDIIGTLCQWVNSSGFMVNGQKVDQTIIVTGDRDILQLVEEGKVYVYMPTKGISEAKLYGEKETVERMGVKPSQIPDFKGLAGDQSDNYPGVGGIGPKTAVSLLEQFHTVKNLYDRGDIGDWGDIGETLKNKLISGRENAFLSLELATIKRDVPIEMDLRPIVKLDTQQLHLELEKLGFKSLIKRLDGMKDKTYNVSDETKEKNIKQTGTMGQQESLF